VLPLQIFNLGLHFISALFIYFTICLLSFNRARSLPYRSAVVGYALYLFMPATLWFQGNVYMNDMAVHTLYIIGVYIALKMIIRQRFYSPKYILLYTIVLGLMLYTSWLGVFFAVGVLVYSLLHVRSIKGFSILIWSTVFTSLIVLRLIVYQYAQINGPGAYAEEMFSRYMVRGSLAETDKGVWHFMFSYLWYIKTLLYNYLINYGAVYLVLGLFVWLAASRSKLKIIFSENGYRFIWLSITPIVLLHVFLMNYSAHDFTTLYASLFFSVLLAILYDKVKKSGSIPIVKLRAGLVVLLLLLLAQYYVINWHHNPAEKQLGQAINELTNNHKTYGHITAFTNLTSISPQVIFYAGHNVRYAPDYASALLFLQQHHAKAGVRMHVNDDMKIDSVEFIENRQ